ncbi:MAG: hypothetical protein B7Y54_01890 [Polaromonas sp. 35-63-240]|nr:MAG: hypothetical protein B7Y54_01890 [Polaromonas sp. 35-63-240]
MLGTLALDGCALQRPYDVVEQGEYRRVTVNTPVPLTSFTKCLHVQLDQAPYSPVLPDGVSLSKPAIRRISLKDGYELRSISTQAYFVARLRQLEGAIEVSIYSNTMPGVPPSEATVTALAVRCGDTSAQQPALRAGS